MKQKALTLMCKTVRAAAVAASTTIVAEELYAKMPTSDLFSLQSPGGHTTSDYKVEAHKLNTQKSGFQFYFSTQDTTIENVSIFQ